MALDNLARIAAAATPGRWIQARSEVLGVVTEDYSRDIAYDIGAEGVPQYEADAALIAAAPEMARLLQECAEALLPLAATCCTHCMSDARLCDPCRARDLLARLAEFDRGLA